MKASILDLRRHMNDVLKAIDRNETVTLTYRGKEKGVIYPAKKHKAKKVSSHPAFGIWKGRDDMHDVDEVIDTLRKVRTHAV
ncbi:MAG: type II toxin-antitoxin system prevent-host-death family antitoxin [bacterium]